jgi:hypothetical protein
MTDRIIDDTIGASDVPVILGLSPWQTPAQLWARKVGLLTRDEGNAATARGHMLEVAILWDYAQRHGLAFEQDRRGNMALAPCWWDHLVRGPEYGCDDPPSDTHAPHPWARCRPDAYVVQYGSVSLLVEVKTTRSWRDWNDAEGRPILPPGYFAQVQWQMLVTGVEETVVEAYCVMDDSRRSITVPAAPRIQAQILERVAAWRERHLMGSELPEDVTADIAGLIWPAPREPEEWLEPTAEDIELAAAYEAATAQIAELEAKRQVAKDKLCVRIGAAAGITGLCSWRATKRGRTFRLLKKEDQQ